MFFDVANLSDIVFMNVRSVVFVSLLFFCGCEPIQEQIIGSYILDPDRGCSSCQTDGPAKMSFEDANITDGIPGSYRFEFSNGALHSGTYGLLQVDTVIAVVLYPDSASSEFAMLIGETVRTDYRIRRKAVKERCNGVFRDCVWNRVN